MACRDMGRNNRSPQGELDALRAALDNVGALIFSKDDRFFYADLGQRWNNNVTDIAFLFDDVGPDRTGNLRAWLVLQPGA